MDFTGRVWGATAAEQAAQLPCDAHMSVPYESWTRAVDVSAPCGLVFRWLGQLTVAPYSYDWIDFRGRRSPDRLTPGLPPPAAGQAFMVFEITDVEKDSHITGVLPEEAAARYGRMAVSYVVSPRGEACRLVVRIDVESRTALRHRARGRLLACGDLVMMRKQLLTLKAFAERDAEDGKEQDSAGELR